MSEQRGWLLSHGVELEAGEVTIVAVTSSCTAAQAT